MKKLLFILLLIPTGALAQTLSEDGIPLPTGETTPVNVCYTGEDGKVVTEIFDSPEIEKDVGQVPFIDLSVIDPGRLIDDIPTFGLAKWHWWLFGFDILPRAQRQYAQCVERITVYEELLGWSLTTDGVWRERILSIMEYTVPFEPVQNPYSVKKPPTKKHAIDHIKAAILGVNITVNETGLCTQYAEYLRGLVYARFGIRDEKNIQKGSSIK